MVRNITRTIFTANHIYRQLPYSKTKLTYLYTNFVAPLLSPHRNSIDDNLYKIQRTSKAAMCLKAEDALNILHSLAATMTAKV